MPRLFDSHAHLDSSQFRGDLDGLLTRAGGVGVERVINVGFDGPSSRRSAALAVANPGIWAAVGYHPHDAKAYNDQAEAELDQLLTEPRVVALGEIGLDYYRDLSPRSVQKEVFARQIALARQKGKPVIIHDREAHEDILDILRSEESRGIGGVMHCFSGDWEMAKICLDLGLFVSMAGTVTFSNARNLHEVARRIPLDNLLIETDCPYLAPAPHRGKRNEPAYVSLVAGRIAELRGDSFEEIAEITFGNACRAFGLDLPARETAV